MDLNSITHLRRLNYTWTKIATMLGISRSTLYRRLREAGIPTNDHTQLSDSQLDDVLREIKADHCNDGEVLMQGHLVRMGIRITREALRNSIHRVDHAGTVARCSNTVRRRIYSVPHPNYIWHIDGHHKLIRWRFVIHGAIDGFSRTIIYLSCADNNRALTVLNCFREGVSQYGLPDHVRSDHGGENVGVWRFMIANHNLDYACVISGSSVHNERIERLWRDVHRCVGSTYATLFCDIESSGILDPTNEVDLFCLHYIYTAQINRSIAQFKESWNSHHLSLEGNMSPNQLFFEGILAVDRPAAVPAGTTPTIDIGDTEERVAVPRISFTPCPVLLQAISVIDPLQVCSDKGITMYRTLLQIIGQHLLNHCSMCTTLQD